jgi:hypothetical protein
LERKVRKRVKCGLAHACAGRRTKREERKLLLAVFTMHIKKSSAASSTDNNIAMQGQQLALVWQC